VVKKSSNVAEADLACVRSHSFFENQLVDRNQLARVLSLSPSYISKLMVAEALPHLKIGRSVRFDVMEVMAFLKERKRP
jgi:excisionase family DNA binding protein